MATLFGCRVETAQDAHIPMMRVALYISGTKCHLRSPMTSSEDFRCRDGGVCVAAVAGCDEKKIELLMKLLRISALEKDRITQAAV